MHRMERADVPLRAQGLRLLEDLLRGVVAQEWAGVDAVENPASCSRRPVIAQSSRTGRPQGVFTERVQPLPPVIPDMAVRIDAHARHRVFTDLCLSHDKGHHDCRRRVN